MRSIALASCLFVVACADKGAFRESIGEMRLVGSRTEQATAIMTRAGFRCWDSRFTANLVNCRRTRERIIGHHYDVVDLWVRDGVVVEANTDTQWGVHI